VRAEFLGDSYDIVKQSLLQWLGSIGTWAAHPMFTESLSPEQTSAFSCLLGTRLLSKETFTLESDRRVYLAPARDCGCHVFLDPDTGIRLEPTRGRRAPLYVFGTELVEIASARPDRLTLVFDQCLARGREREQLRDKLSYFAEQGLYGFAYASHASFVLVGKDGSLVNKALETLKRESRLPDSRFVVQEPQNNQFRRTSPAQAKLKSYVPFVAAVLVSSAVIGLGAYAWANREGFRNVRICETLKPGITASGLTAALGQPVHRSNSNGETWWYFQTPSIMAGPIRAHVSESGRHVVSLHCHEDGPPTWTLSQ